MAAISLFLKGLLISQTAVKAWMKENCFIVAMNIVLLLVTKIFFYTNMIFISHLAQKNTVSGEKKCVCEMFLFTYSKSAWYHRDIVMEFIFNLRHV